MTKAERKSELKKQMGRGQSMISSAEFRYGFKEIDHATLTRERNKGSDLILLALDGVLESEAEELAISLASMRDEFRRGCV